MMDMILFGAIGMILLVLIGLLIVILKDHNHGKKQFELYMQQSQREISDMKREDSKRREQPTEERLEAHGVQESKSHNEPTPASESSTSQASTQTAGPQPIEPTVIADTAHQTAQTAVTEEKPKSEPSQPKLEPSISLVTPMEPKSAREASPAPENEAEIAEIKNKSYGTFDYQRLLDMGLSQSEAEEFVVELIHQLEAAVPQIESAASSHDLVAIEHITHGIKGAALNVGHGGVADLLVDYNTYMKHGTDENVAAAYLDKLKESISDLKVEFSQVA